MRSGVLILCLVVSGAPAFAQSKDPQPGKWVIARADEWPDVCHITLTSNETIGGRAVVLAKDCAKSFLWTAEITAWRIASTGNAILADATRKGLIELKSTDDGDFTGVGPDKQQYVLSPDREAKTKACKKN